MNIIMNIKKYKNLILIVVIIQAAVFFSSCNNAVDKDKIINNLNQENKSLMSQNLQLKQDNKALLDQNLQLKKQTKPQKSKSVLNTSLTVMQLLKNRDMDSLASYVHPNKGVRFSPYSHIDLEKDLVFKADQVSKLSKSTKIYNWGIYDGSGAPIKMTFNDYYSEFIYDMDFSNPNIIGNNIVVGRGNMVNNIFKAYPNAKFVEFHFTGSKPDYQGMDWRSLRLVFENSNGTWYLVGIVHDQWTI